MTTDRWRDFDTWLKSLEAHGLPAPPRSIIAEVVGTGAAAKEQVQAMLRVLLPGAVVAGADAADALAVAIAHAHHRPR